MTDANYGLDVSAHIAEITMKQQNLVNRTMIRNGGITEHQAQIMNYIGDNPGLIQKDIVELVQRRAATVSVLLASLERADLIVRVVPDGNSRKKVLSLTAKGKRAIAAYAQATEDVRTAMVSRLTLAQQEQLLRLLAEASNGLD